MSEPEPARYERSQALIESRKGSVGWSFGLTGVALLLGVITFLRVNFTYAKYRGHDIEPPEWFAINVDLLFESWGVGFVAAFLLSISLSSYLGWARSKSWRWNVGFGTFWLTSAFFTVGLVVSTL